MDNIIYIIIITYIKIFIMIPGFITLYRKNDLICLYFYKGYVDDNNAYYNSLDMSKCIYNYKIVNYEDGAKEYIFDNKKIKSITCNLVKYNNEINIVKLTI